MTEALLSVYWRGFTGLATEKNSFSQKDKISERFFLQIFFLLFKNGQWRPRRPIRNLQKGRLNVACVFITTLYPTSVSMYVHYSIMLCTVYEHMTLNSKYTKTKCRERQKICNPKLTNTARSLTPHWQTQSPIQRWLTLLGVGLHTDKHIVRFSAD